MKGHIRDLKRFDENGIYQGEDHGRPDYPRGDKMDDEQKRILKTLKAKKDRTPHEESVLHGLEGLSKRDK